jgi:hypothetical protein
MAAVHLEAHGGDVEKSLAAASSRQSWGLGPDCQRGPSKQERISGECLPGTQLVFDSSCVPVSAPMVHLPARCFSRCSWHGQETYQKAVTPVNTSCVPVSVLDTPWFAGCAQRRDRRAGQARRGSHESKSRRKRGSGEGRSRGKDALAPRRREPNSSLSASDHSTSRPSRYSSSSRCWRASVSWS